MKRRFFIRKNVRILIFALLFSLIITAFVGCSGDKDDTSAENEHDATGAANALKKLGVIYETAETAPQFNRAVDCETAINNFFSDETHKGFIAKISPIEYTFYYTVTNDAVADTYVVGGYAECKCSITNVSRLFNLSEYSEREIVVRQKMYLVPKDTEYTSNILERVGALHKTESGESKAVDGTYKIPDEFISASKFSLRISDETQVLSGEGPYYALIYFDGDTAHFYSICDGRDEYGAALPTDVATRASDFKKYLLANYPQTLA